MLVIKVDRDIFKQEMENAGRDYFSYEAIDILIDMFEEFEGTYTLDPIAIACDFTEDDPETIKEEYGHVDDKIKDAGTIEELVEVLNYYTMAWDCGNGMILYANF